MNPLPYHTTDDQLIAFVDGWAALMEREDYEGAFAYTDHVPNMGWTPALLSEVVKAYGDAEEGQKVTLLGVPTDITQRKQVDRKKPGSSQRMGEIWYDLNINGYASDLTATFQLRAVQEGILVRLNDIHIM